jgi:hypothetical protein
MPSAAAPLVPGAPAPGRPRPLATWAVLGLFILLAVVHTWPLASAPGRFSRNDNLDTLLGEWMLAWVAHQVVRDPIHLFDANIFYPERRTLAYSENLVVQSLMVAPISWAGGSPVLAFNLALIGGFALTGWAAAFVMRRWTGSWLAGIMSGSLMAFNAHTLTRLAHLQAQHLEFFPFVLLALDRLLASPKRASALQLAGWFVLQSLTSIYFMVFTAVAIAAAVAVRPREWLGPRFRSFAPQAALAAGVAIAALAPFLLPYVLVSREQEGFSRSLDEVALYSAKLTDYLATGGTLHFELWSRQFWQGDGLFPGVTATALTLVALATGVAISDRRARMGVAFGCVAFALSFGPKFPLYSVVYRLFPGMAAIRAALRFGQITLAGFAILAGFGLDVIHKRMAPRWALPVCLVLLLTAHAEALRAPLLYNRYGGIPPVLRSLNTPKPAVVAAFPFYPPSAIWLNAHYMLYSTVFWKPMLNGYSGFVPATYVEHAQHLGGFPDETSIRYLEGLGVTHVLVDGRSMNEDVLARLANVPELSLWGTDGNLLIYLLK